MTETTDKAKASRRKFLAGAAGLVAAGAAGAARAEGRATPRMMTVGLHPRVIGHPGRIAALVKFLDHVGGRDGVWIARRADIAAHWRHAVPAKELAA